MHVGLRSAFVDLIMKSAEFTVHDLGKGGLWVRASYDGHTIFADIPDSERHTLDIRKRSCAEALVQEVDQWDII